MPGMWIVAGRKERETRMKVWNFRNPRKPGNAIYVGRPSKWGNPFIIDFDGETTREQAIEAYREWIKTQPELLNSLHELKGKDLVCWCAPKACHADVLMELANK